jgi:hypothetical protein
MEPVVGGYGEDDPRHPPQKASRETRIGLPFSSMGKEGDADEAKDPSRSPGHELDGL